MNRRGFFGLLGKLAAVGTAMSVSPAILKPVEKWARKWTITFHGIEGATELQLINNEDVAMLFEVRMTNERTGGSFFARAEPVD